MKHPLPMSDSRPEFTLSQLREEDYQATVTLIEYLLPHIHRLVRLLGRRHHLDPFELDDIAQEVILSLYKRLPQLLKQLPDQLDNDELRQHLRSWASSVVRSHVAHSSRARSLHRIGEVKVETEGPGAVEAPRQQRATEAKELLELLAVNLRDVDRRVLQYLLEGWRPQEIAQRMDVSPTQLYARIRTIQRKLRRVVPDRKQASSG